MCTITHQDVGTVRHWHWHCELCGTPPCTVIALAVFFHYEEDHHYEENVRFCSSITPISSLVKLCGNRLPLTPRVSELGGLAFPTKTFRDTRVGVSKIFAPPPEICQLLVGATHRARADPPKCQKTRPQTHGGKRPTLGMRAWSSNAPPRAVLGQKSNPNLSTLRLYVDVDGPSRCQILPNRR